MVLVQRYYFRQLLWPFLVAMAAFAGLALLTQSLSNIDLISGYQETTWTFFKVTLLALPHLTALLAPIALFVAALTALNRLTADSEIVVSSASGLSRRRVLSPLIRLAVFVIIGNLAVNLFVQPVAYREMRRSLHELRSDVAASLVRPGAFSRLGSGVTLYARERSSGGRMQDVFIHDSRAEGGSVTYAAREGVVVRTEVRPVMVLIDGNRQEVDVNGAVTDLTFDRFEFDLGDFVGPVDAMFFKDSDKFLHELLWPDAVSLSQSRGLERPRAEAHYRLSAPLYNLAVVLIAAAVFFAGDFQRTGYARRVQIAVAVMLALRLSGFAVQSAASDDPIFNIVQYLIPIGGSIGALAVIYWPARRRPRRDPAPAAGA